MLGTFVLHLTLAVPQQVYPGMQEVEVQFDAPEDADTDGDANEAPIQAQGRQIGIDLVPGTQADNTGASVSAGETSCCYGTSTVAKIPGFGKFGLDTFFNQFLGQSLLSIGGVALTAVTVLGGLAAFGLVPLGGIGTLLTTAIAGLGLGGLARDGFGFDGFNREEHHPHQSHHHPQVEHHHQIHEKAQHKFDDYYQHQQ